MSQLEIEHTGATTEGNIDTTNAEATPIGEQAALLGLAKTMAYYAAAAGVDRSGHGLLKLGSPGQDRPRPAL